MRLLLSDFVAPHGCYHVARMDYLAGRACRLHTHDFAELFFIEAGRGLHLFEGGEEAEIVAGDVVLVRPDDSHGFRAARGGGFTLVNVAFEADVVEHIRRRYFGDAADWPGAGGERPAAWRLGPAGLQQLSTLSQRLSTQAQRRIDLECFLLSALQLLTEVDERPDAAHPAWLRQAIADFTGASDLTGGVAQFAALADRSVEHVNRTVQRCYGKTTTELVVDLRLERAAHLLRMTSRPITTVAFDSGFDNLGYFYRRFRQQFGTTPRRFRQAAHSVAR